MRDERTATIALNMVPGIGAVLARRMAEAFGSVAAAVGASAEALRRVPGIGPERAEAFARVLGSVDPDTEVARARDAGIQIVTASDDAYPRLLREIHDPPLALYVRGSAEAMETACAAMVGTRGPTQYGRETASRFAFQLAQTGVTIVSGLARGIDTESHRAALRAKGRTIAVIGSALDEIYPRENTGLADEIAASGGAVVSEYPFGRKADRQTFPMRNRIVSGLSRAVLVVEAGVTSGTLITANHALEQGRAVLAVPGRIDNPAALGCLKLIRQGARLAECIDDVLEEMQTLRGFGATRTPPRPAAPERQAPSLFEAAAPALPKPEPMLDEAERALLEALRDAGGEADVEQLLAKTGLPAYKVNAKLISLEMKRKARQLPGRRVSLER